MKSKLQKQFVFDLHQTFKYFLFCLIFIFLNENVYSHGTVIWPKSRIKTCHDNPNSNNCGPCGSSIYEWRSILQPDTNYGRHRDFVSDGQLASGGNPDKYSCLDALISWPTQSDWNTTKVNYGDIYVKWKNTAPHKTQYYKVYITPLDWNPSKPLKWDDLMEIGHVGKRPAEDFTEIKAYIPDSYIGKRAVLYSVWQRDYGDSHEAFYSVSDIEIVASGGGSSDDGNHGDDGDQGGGDHDHGGGDHGGDHGGGSNCDNIPLWKEENIYVANDSVRFMDKLYQAKWWTRGDNPLQFSNRYDVWKNIDDCKAQTSTKKIEKFKDGLVTEDDFRVFQNPFTDKIKISLNTVERKVPLKIVVKDISGNLYYEELISTKESDQFIVINPKVRSKGVYILQIIRGNKVLKNHKLIRK